MTHERGPFSAGGSGARDGCHSFKDFIRAEDAARHWGHMETPRVESLREQLGASKGARAQLLHNGDRLEVWPDQGGFFCLYPDGTWDMDTQGRDCL